ncbi:MAG: plastocyanin/azurin family copper-binding protein [Actinomycetota bacterium]|nr:plastocyanin/azurin family copper-binding protein [Actinomycetota bacterium]
MKKRPLALLALVCVAIVPACGGGSKGAEKPKVSGPQVVAKKLRFRPSKMAVKVGSDVTWTFEDKGIPHNVTADDGSFRSENKAEGTYVHRFAATGLFTYTCTIHPATMKGAVEVRA